MDGSLEHMVPTKRATQTAPGESADAARDAVWQAARGRYCALIEIEVPVGRLPTTSDAPRGTRRALDDAIGSLARIRGQADVTAERVVIEVKALIDDAIPRFDAVRQRVTDEAVLLAIEAYYGA